MVLLLDFFPLSSYLNSIEHKAPSSTPLRPLSLQDAGRTLPHSVGNIHQGDWSNGQGFFFTLNLA